MVRCEDDEEEEGSIAERAQKANPFSGCRSAGRGHPGRWDGPQLAGGFLSTSRENERRAPMAGGVILARVRPLCGNGLGG